MIYLFVSPGLIVMAPAAINAFEIYWAALVGLFNGADRTEIRGSE
jgi:hypothetical protein